MRFVNDRGTLLHVVLALYGLLTLVPFAWAVLTSLKTVREISLAEALQPATIAAYGRRATGEKFLINPNKATPGSGAASAT